MRTCSEIEIVVPMRPCILPARKTPFFLSHGIGHECVLPSFESNLLVSAFGDKGTESAAI